MHPLNFLAWVFLLAAVIVSESGVCAAAATQEDSLAARGIPAEYFGMHFHRADSTTAWPAASIGSWRLWDAGVAWPQLEAQRGRWDFRRLDRYVAMARLTKTSILLPLGLTPVWASSRPTEKSAYQPGNAAEPANIEDWRKYVRAVAERYKSKIQDYEIWNEVNVPSFYSGSVDSLVALTREAYKILKEVDPRNRLVGPSVVGGGVHLKWLDGFFEKGGGQYIDVVGYHFYVPKEAPEAMLPMISEVRALMLKHGLGRVPLWNTETGWLIRNDDGPFTPGKYDRSWKILEPNVAASYLLRSMVLSWWAGVQRLYWYAWDNETMGFIEPQSGTIKKPGDAYGVASGWLRGATVTGCAKQIYVWICTLQKQSSLAYILWTESEKDALFTIPDSWVVATTERIDGAKRARVYDAPLRIEPAYPLLLTP